MREDAREFGREARYEPESPFAETMPEAEEPAARTAGSTPWAESATPFAETIGEGAPDSRSEQMLAEVLSELRDESFDEALAYLAEETEQAVSDRFTNETPASATERERFADAHLSAVRFEAEQYLEALEAGLTGMDVESLNEQQLDEALERFDPQSGELTPAGEEFVGALVRKAKAVVKQAISVSKSVSKIAGKIAAGPLGLVLQKLKGLIQPLLKRVLGFAIGRLPPALQDPARALASRFLSEAGQGYEMGEGEGEGFDEASVSPANLTDVEALAEQFDAALAEAVAGEGPERFESELNEARDSEDAVGSRELEVLAEARGALIDRLGGAGAEENLGPAVEQFVPALLSVVRMGIKLAGRPKIINFLAGQLAKLLQKWVKPELAGPLSSAIVDTGFRLLTLEAETGVTGEMRADEAGPVALASVVEDTIRRFAENEDYVFENEELMQLAASEAFSQAVATHFPQRFVRPALQQAPTLGGTFVARRPRSTRPYSKYNRTPEVEISAQIADALPTFGGTTLGATLRAAGVTFPIRARMHIYQAGAGTSLPRMVRMDRPGGAPARARSASPGIHPLTRTAAGILVREPGLGVGVPAPYLKTPHRIAIGQRFYVLEPLGTAAALAMPPGGPTRAVAARQSPSRAWMKIDLLRSRIVVGLYVSEADAQAIAEALRQGRGGAALLQKLIEISRTMDRSAAGQQGGSPVAREDREELEGVAPATRRLLPPAVKDLLKRRLGAWIRPNLAAWVRDNAEAFVRAAAHPDPGVTIRIELTSVPGLDLIGQIAKGGGAAIAASLKALRGTPTVAISMTPGRHRRPR